LTESFNPARFELAERVEFEDGVGQAIPINTLEEYYGIDWDLMVSKICKFGFVAIGPYIPFYNIKVPNDFGTGYDGIQMCFLSPDDLTQPLTCIIQNKAMVESTGFGNYGILMTNS
jgi:hypothetical protein